MNRDDKAPRAGEQGGTYPSGASVTGWALSPEVASSELVDRSTFVRSARLALGMVAEDVLGIMCVLSTDFKRTSGWIPAGGATIYLVHAIFGFFLVIGAMALVAHVRASGRVPKALAWIGAAGLLVASLGGLATVHEQLRSFGVVVMAIGSLGAVTSYLTAVFLYRQQTSSRGTG
ncbi:MAG: hypothetical protein ACRDZ6_10315 [Acidimicrobiales bacterium]